MLAPWLLILTLAAGDPPPFKVTSKHPDDRVKVLTQHDQTILDITSPTGISRATVERTGEKWPEALVLRLYLTGLEGLRISKAQSGDTPPPPKWGVPGPVPTATQVGCPRTRPPSGVSPDPSSSPDT